MRTIAARLALAGLLLLLAGCAGGPGAYTAVQLQARCVATGGVWHPALAREGYCEFQSPGMI